MKSERRTDTSPVGKIISRILGSVKPPGYSSLTFNPDPDSDSGSDPDLYPDPDAESCNPNITKRKSIRYAVPAIKVQNHSLQEIREKRLFILLPFTPIRFRTMLRKRKALQASSQPRKSAIFDRSDSLDSPNLSGSSLSSDFPDTASKNETLDVLDTEENTYYETAKLELTNFFHEIILILNEAVETGYICELDRKDILALLRKAMIRVFQEDDYLLEVVNHMTAPILELERETIARQTKELEEKNAMIAEKDTLIQAQKAEIESLKADNRFLKNWRKRLKIRKHT